MAYNAATDALPAPEDDAAFIRERARIRDRALTDADLIENMVMLYGIRLRRAAVPGFTGVGVERPGYESVIVFAREPIDPAAYTTLAAPEIRHLITFRERHFDEAMRQSSMDRLSAAFGPGSGVCMFVYEIAEDKFLLGLDDGADEAAVAARVPADLLPHIRFAPGDCIIAT